MALESGTFIGDLVVTNPPGTDDKRQGDDHIRLVKTVLKNTFPNATKAFMLPSGLTKTASYAVTAADQNATIVVNNPGEITLTMPALLTTDAGWMVTIIKLSTGFPLFVAPPSGVVISGQVVVARARRAIPNIPFRVFWTGSNWVVDRIATVPIGSLLPFFAVSLPVGYEWPNGQALAAASYPEYAALVGPGTPDLRQRALVGTDLGSADTGRITSVISPSLGNSGGSQFIQSHNHSASSGVESAAHSHGGQTLGSLSTGYNLDHTHGYNDSGFAASNSTQPGGNPPGGNPTSTDRTTSTSSLGALDHTHLIRARLDLGTEDANHNHAITVDFAGAGGSQNMPPSFICHYALVVE